jgi:LmbE family N-acetylglucosaminyl deacetylase
LSFNFNFVKNGPILFIGCHPDDVEIGCGGLIHKLKNLVPVYTLTLSKNIKNPKNKNVIKEHLESLKILGVKKQNIILGDFTTREFSYSRQEILDFIVKIGKKIKPTCIFTHSVDLHQDHQVCHHETLRAFRTKTIFEYYISRSMYNPKPTFFVEIDKKNLDAKIKALSKFKTYQDKNYFSDEVISSLCKSWGIRAEIPMCEAFNPLSIII